MKKINSTILFLIITLIITNVFGQANPTISVIGLGTTDPTNAGVVAVGATLDLQITIGNTGTANIVASKLRPVITIPAIVTFLPDAQQPALPTGWIIVSGSNTGSQIRICNGSDIIPGSANRTIILKVQGVTIGGPSTFTGNLFFGGATCSVAGAAPSGNNGADDVGTSSITVVAAVVPLTLTDFSANLKECQPVLYWTTASEINTDRFEIEKSNINATDWKVVGNVTASGFSNSKINYSFIDKDLNASSEKVFYRLKMVDKDGRFTFSKILPILLNCKSATILFYPNPVHDDKLYISLAGTVGYVEANLMAMSGQVILKKKMINGTNDLNVSNIADGIYMLRVTDANGFDKNIKVSIGH